MKYASLDLETTCINPKIPSNILQVSIVIEDTENPLPLEKLPHFTCFIKHKVVSGDPYALGMNGWILDTISGRTESKYPIFKNEDWILAAKQFLFINFKQEILDKPSFKIPIAGKNVANFDLNFLPKPLVDMFEYRIIDPTSVFWNPKDSKMKSLGAIKKELGIEGEVAHDAYEDALDVIKVLRTKYV